MVQKFGTLDDAVALATFAHRNQKDKAGLDYIQHPLRVLEKVKAQGGLPYVQIAAILHDVTEDTAFTPQMLLDLGFSEASVDIVRLVDRHDAERVWALSWKNLMPDNAGDLTEDEFSRVKNSLHVDFYYDRIAKNAGAKMVKLADIEDNLSPWRLSYLSEETQSRLRLKYAKARDILDA